MPKFKPVSSVLESISPVLRSKTTIASESATTTFSSSVTYGVELRYLISPSVQLHSSLPLFLLSAVREFQLALTSSASSLTTNSAPEHSPDGLRLFHFTIPVLASRAVMLVGLPAKIVLPSVQIPLLVFIFLLRLTFSSRSFCRFLR